jgi:two-component system, OmpR family, copper resistance phosphate regulon response regulator CusR
MRILIIEDDKKIAAAIAKNLRAESYAVDLATNGVQGEELANVNEYDIILLDLLLPKQDGWTTCTHLRRDGILTPILMLTAFDDVADKIKGLDAGADDYLSKPFHIGELLARIRSLTRRTTEVRTTRIEHAGLSLDLNTHRASRDGKSIKLSTKEFALLELFMMHPEVIISREMISEHLWDMNFEPRSNVIESFVKFLRQKIDLGFSRSLIHTVRGAGYIFSTKEP